MTHPWTDNALWRQRKLSLTSSGGAPDQPSFEPRRPDRKRPANPALCAPQWAECARPDLGRAA